MSASSSGAGAASGWIWALRKSSLRWAYSFASRRISLSRKSAPARLPPPPVFPPCPRSTIIAAGERTSMSSSRSPARSITTACPGIRPSSGIVSAVVTPSARTTGIVMLAGSMASATLNEAFTSPRTTSSWVSSCAPLSVRRMPRLLPAWMRPGVTHLPLASTTVASGGIAIPRPIAAMRPSRRMTVALSSLGDETG